ncbi:AAA family ATPase [Halomicroarcula sp. F13]|uniref:AAA family ATPase n=1 Tax=Haloarcula rubra TaxID=2487747 RepID=A0AAW4PRQ6_9EURY|nr:AAA family ATPase [Halomicroarcula rubra]MBX0324263.1 AAA family ATPase [Halomicroarcula rubra]
MDAAGTATHAESLVDAVSTVVPSDNATLDTLLTGLVADAHVLAAEDRPDGIARTARGVAAALDLEYSRVQFAAEFDPAALTDGRVANGSDDVTGFVPGPIFANVVVVEGYGRAPPAARSVLQDAMATGAVTLDGERHDLPDPFCVVATPGRSESARTSDACHDRFALSGLIAHPDRADDRPRRDAASVPSSLQRVSTLAAIRRRRARADAVAVGDDHRRFVTDLGRATHRHPAVECGVTPAGIRRLFGLLRARASVHGRSAVTTADVRRVAPAALAHHLTLSRARADGWSARAVVESVLDGLDAPTETRLTA